VPVGPPGTVAGAFSTAGWIKGIGRQLVHAGVEQTYQVKSGARGIEIDPKIRGGRHVAQTVAGGEKILFSIGEAMKNLRHGESAAVILDTYNQTVSAADDRDTDGAVRISAIAMAEGIGECLAKQTVLTDERIPKTAEPGGEKPGDLTFIDKKPVVAIAVRCIRAGWHGRWYQEVFPNDGWMIQKRHGRGWGNGQQHSASDGDRGSTTARH